MAKFPACSSKMALGVCVFAAAAILLRNPAPTAHAQLNRFPVPVASDWSHRHVVFSQPANFFDALRWQQEPRYVQQVLRRNAWRSAEIVLDPNPFGRFHRFRQGEFTRSELDGDWSQTLGTGGTLGAGQYPAKFSFDANQASCANDFVVFHTGLPGSGTQASVIAFTNLYAGCGGTVPTTYWAYNTGGTVTTSVVLSRDGTQVAFVQAQGGAATLVLMKWKSGASTINAPAAPTSVTNANYRACTAPCMTTITLNGSPTVTISAPYYDYFSDTAYLGDDVGKLHQFTGIFLGTPAESGAPWPVTVAVVKLSSPVYDSNTGNVFVTTSRQTAAKSGARVDAICTNATCAGVTYGNGANKTAIGTAVPSNVLGPTETASAACNGTGASGDTADMIVDAPIVDPTAGKVYVFVGNNGNGNSSVYQFSTTVGAAAGNFSFHSCGTSQVTVGIGSTTGIPLFAGDFDNIYYTSATGANPSGNLYVCGNTGGIATLYQLSITNNALPATSTAFTPVLSSANTTCSPVTEVDSGGVDRIFASVQASGATTGGVTCPAGGGGCLMSFNIPTTIAGALPTGTSATLAAAGGSSGIVIDNIVVPGTLQTSQVYFSTLTGSTAIQGSQAALQ